MTTEHDIKIYDDVDSHVEELVAEEHRLKTQLSQDKALTQKELNRLARDKALHIRAKKLEYIKDYGSRSPKVREALLEWCADVAELEKRQVERYVQAGELIASYKFLATLAIGVMPLAAIASKKFNKKEMTAFQQYCITQDKITEQKVHVWAHGHCGKPMPPKIAAKQQESTFLDRPVEANTMEGRLGLGYAGRALLGIHMSTPPDVVSIVCKTWAQRYHPDKGVDQDESQRVLSAIAEVKGK